MTSTQWAMCLLLENSIVRVVEVLMMFEVLMMMIMMLLKEESRLKENKDIMSSKKHKKNSGTITPLISIVVNV